MKITPIKIIASFLFLLIIFLYLYNLGNNPAGFFCDEALFGIRAKELLMGNFKDILSPFFNMHFRYVEGNLTFYPLVPFVGLFGLSEFSVRFASLFFTFLSLPVFYLSLKKLGIKNTLIPIITYLLTPFVIHNSRVYITSITPSIFVMLSAYYFYIRGQKEKKALFFILSGILFGVVSYGYNAFIVSVVLIIFSILAVELAASGKALFRNKNILILLSSWFLLCLPIIYNAYKNPQFFNRLKEKNEYFSNISPERILGMTGKYFKYFDINYLAGSGETHFPNAYIQRHTVTDSGIFLKTTALLIFLSYIILIVAKNGNKRLFAPLFLLYLLHPIPDLISSPVKSSPYTIPLAATFFVIPFMVGYATDHLLNPGSFLKLGLKKQKIFSFIVNIFLVLSLFEGLYFIAITYQKYPLSSAGYWGWQYGPKEMIKYFINNKDRYDLMCMEGVFNEPQVFIEFYDFNDSCMGKCQICSPYDAVNYPKNTLYAQSSESFKEYSLNKNLGTDFEVEKIIYYPNGAPAFYLIKDSVTAQVRLK